MTQTSPSNSDSRDDLTIFYVVEPPENQVVACSLLASIRSQFSSEVQVVGYCPSDKLDELHPGVIRAHEIMNAEIRVFEAENKFSPPYPRGNNILAAIEKRSTKYSMLVDPDVLFLKPYRIENLIGPDRVSCAMLSPEQSNWDDIYEALDIDMPVQQDQPVSQRENDITPHLSSGIVAFPEEAAPGGRRFSEVWLETAQIVDQIEELGKFRPYLDQLSLPAAIRRSGLDWNILPAEQHHILGEDYDGEPIPSGLDIHSLQYRHFKNLNPCGYAGDARGFLKQHTGRKFVRRLAWAS
jgi:hypothetical protein